MPMIVLAPNAASAVYGLERDAEYGVNVYDSPRGTIPAHLWPYLPADHTWEKHVQRLISGTDYRGSDPKARIVFHGDDQPVATDQIVRAYYAGHGGYPLTMPTGSGKTIVAIAAMNRIQPARVLVVSTLTHVTTWREEISRYSHSNIEWVVTNPDQLGGLLWVDDMDVQLLNTDVRDAIVAERGKPLSTFDVVIYDESHQLAAPDSQRSRMWRRLARWGQDGPGAFTLNLSATPWSDPTQTSCVAHLLARRLNVAVPDMETIESGYREWLRDQGFALRTTGNHRWRWEENAEDTDRLTRLLFRDGWGTSITEQHVKQPREVYPIRLTAIERDRMENAWRNYGGLDLGVVFDNPELGMTKALRAVQKASLIKAPYVARLVAQLVADGKQVIVPAWYTETANQLGIHIARALESLPADEQGRRPAVYVMTGKDTPTVRDQKKRRFQSGIAHVIVTSITDSINLHASQAGGGVGGADATPTERVTVFADVLTGGKRAFQGEGRGTRDGQVARVIYTYVEDSIEQDWLHDMFLSLTNTRALSYLGDRHNEYDIETFTELAHQLERDTQEIPA